MAELPIAPERLQGELRQFDPRLRLVWNAHYRVWQVEEFLKRQGTWSHVMYWCDGAWNDKKFRALPDTAAPLIAEIQRRDVSKAERGGSVLGLAKQLEAQGAHARAQAAIKKAEERKRKWASWDYAMRHWAERLVSLHNLGGNSARRAHAERMAIRRDLGIGQG